MKNLIVLFVFILIGTSFPQGITLRDTTNQYDYIIITVPEFVPVCQIFKQHKESYNGFNVLIVDTGQIYTEFNSDSLPQNNIREFVSYAGTFWKAPQPKYFLLIGNTDAVPNFIIQSISPPNNPYQRSDYHYAISLNETDTLTAEFNIGRLPAFSSTELTHYFNKVIWYENNSQLNSWIYTNTFLCESDTILKILEQSMAIAQNLPGNINKRFIEDVDSSINYGNLDTLINFINDFGSSIVWFSGRSIDSSFMTDPEFLSIDDLELLNNNQKYFVSIFYSQTAVLDSNTNISREMLFLESAGSIGGIVVNGSTFWPTIAYFQREWAKKIYSNQHYSIPEVMNTELDRNAHYQRVLINFWGDPSLKLKYDPNVNVAEENQEIPDGYALYSNYPNPYNNSTKISYEIPVQSNVSIILYDVLGREVATLVNEVKPSGKHQFNFVENNLVSGVYFYTLRAGNFVQTKKMVLLK